MELDKKLKKLIIDALKPLSPDRIILFGSYAYGTPSADSDVDLLVVLSDETMPENYKKKLELNRIVAKALMSFTKKTPTDLIVYTRPEWVKFVSYGSSFSKEILDKGIQLL